MCSEEKSRVTGFEPVYLYRSSFPQILYVRDLLSDPYVNFKTPKDKDFPSFLLTYNPCQPIETGRDYVNRRTKGYFFVSSTLNDTPS